MGLLSSIAGGVISGIGGLIGSTQNRHAQESANQANYQMQKEFAQNGIRWKVADAKAAGLHPLAALNAYTTSYQPSNTAFTSDLAEVSRDLGQGVQRAIEAKATEEERAADRAYQIQSRDNSLRLQRLQIKQAENDVARQQFELSQAMLATQQQVPAMPASAKSSGQVTNAIGTTGGSNFVDKTSPEFGWWVDANGRKSLGASLDFKQLTEDTPFAWLPFISGAVNHVVNKWSNKVVDNHIYHWRLNSWVPLDSPEGREALAARQKFAKSYAANPLLHMLFPGSSDLLRARMYGIRP